VVDYEVKIVYPSTREEFFYSGSVDYQEANALLPKYVTWNTRYTDAKRPEFREYFRVKQYAIQAPPKRNFSLAAFGLGDFDRPSNRRSRYGAALWAACVSILALAITIVLRRRAAACS
jgi:hypothetical protein